MFLKILLVIAFVAVAVGVGIYCRRSTKTVDGFVLGGRNVGPWMSAFAYGTSYFSAVVFVGYAGQFGFKYGIAATWAGIGNAIIGSLLAWWVLGPRTREITHRLGAQTMPEFFGKRYNSKALRIAAAAIIFVFLIPYTASVYNGLSRLFGMAFNLPYDVCVIGMAVVTCIYVVVGGYMATVMNDFIQGIVMLLGISAVIVVVLLNNGGFSEAIVEPVAAARGRLGYARALRQLLRTRPAEPAGRGGAHVAGHLGPAADGAEVLRHQERPGREAGRHHLHHLRLRGGWRLATSWAASGACTPTRSSTPPTARPSTTRSSPPCSPPCPTC